MVFFNNATINKLDKVVIKNAKGQLITQYSKNSCDIVCNVQPITEKSKFKDWGEQIDANFNVYLNLDLFEIGDYLVWNNKTYMVKEKIVWDTYTLLAIKESDVVYEQ
ncbi:MAG: hypothetical protein ACI33J_03350 [Clostridium sp.]